MKILHLSLNSLVMDGWTYQDNMLTKYHHKLGYEVIDVTSHWIFDDKGNMAIDPRKDYINQDGVRMIRLDMIGREDYRRKIRKFKGLSDILEESKPDYLFIHSVNFADITTVVRYLKNHRNVIAFADNHGDFSNTAKNWLSKNILHKVIWRYYSNKLVPYVKKFYGVLPARVDFIKDMYHLPPKMCELLVMGADDEKIEAAQKKNARAEIRNQYGIKENDFLIMTGGKIDLAKTQTLLLMEAVKSIQNQNLKLIVFGSVASELKDKVAELTDDERIQYIGWVQSDNSYDYFSAADLVVFPGRHSVFWEQVAGQGIPMVVKDWPGTHHVDLGGNVRFIENDCTEEIKAIIEDIVNNPKNYSRMKSIAVEHGMKEFSYMDIARRAISC